MRFAAELLGRVLHIEVPDFQDVRLVEATLNEIVPVGIARTRSSCSPSRRRYSARSWW